jgi:hypothetical protein
MALSVRGEDEHLIKTSFCNADSRVIGSVRRSPSSRWKAAHAPSTNAFRFLAAPILRTTIFGM